MSNLFILSFSFSLTVFPSRIPIYIRNEGAIIIARYLITGLSLSIKYGMKVMLDSAYEAEPSIMTLFLMPYQQSLLSPANPTMKSAIFMSKGANTEAALSPGNL